MMASLYETLSDGEGFRLLRGRDILKFACCDCGMVHYVRIQLTRKEKYFWMRFWKDNRATAQLRRHKYGNLQKNANPAYRIIRRCA